ncbi:MAG: methyl-accepting chemotaxis protein [Bacillaceae bacterium]|nr:methyl-accepting chemotaxis protein [Bacillaceae bacterium]
MFIQKSFDPVAFSLLSYIRSQERLLLTNEQRIVETTSAIRIIYLLLAGLSIILSLVLSTIFANRLTKKIVCLKSNAIEVAAGNLNVDKIEIHSKDEIGELGHAFNGMTDSLRVLISGANEVSSQVAAASAQLQASAEQTSTSTEHIATVIQDIAQGAIKQVELVDANVDTIQLLSEKVSDITKSADSVFLTVQRSEQTANEGKVDLSRAITQVKMIEQSTKNIGQAIKKIRKRIPIISLKL